MRFLIFFVLVILNLSTFCQSAEHFGLKQKTIISNSNLELDSTVFIYDRFGRQTFPNKEDQKPKQLSTFISIDTIENRKQKFRSIFYFNDYTAERIESKSRDSNILQVTDFKDSARTIITRKYISKSYFSFKCFLYQKGTRIMLNYSDSSKVPFYADTSIFSFNPLTRTYKTISKNKSNNKSFVSEKFRRSKGGLLKFVRNKEYHDYHKQYFLEKKIYTYDSENRIIKEEEYDLRPLILTSKIIYEYY